MSKISLKDIANRAGVSVGTVDRVIHRRGKVSKEAEKKVLQAINDLNYSPNLVARSLARKENYSIAVLLPTLNRDPFWALPMQGVEHAQSFIRDFGFEIKLLPYDENQRKSLLQVGKEVLNGSYHAVLIAPLLKEESVTLFQEWRKAGIPYVQINTYIPREDDPSFLCYVGQDSYGSGKLAAKLLNLSVQSDEALLILHLEKEFYNQQHLVEKEEGFRRYFKDHHSKKNRIIQHHFAETFDSKEQSRFFKSLLTRHPDIGGVFITTSRTYQIFENLRFHAKKDLHIVGFDLLEPNLQLLEAEKVDFLIHQNPVRQGYLGIMNIFRHLLQKKKIQPIQNLPLDVVMAENMKYYQQEYEQQLSIF